MGPVPIIPSTQFPSYVPLGVLLLVFLSQNAVLLDVLRAFRELTITETDVKCP